MGKPVVLIVEDKAEVQKTYVACIGDLAEVLQAMDVDTGRELIEKHSERITAAIMDGQVPDREGGMLHNHQADTVPLVKLLREKGSRAKIVAISTDPEMLRQLGEAGCDMCLNKAAVWDFRQLPQWLELEPTSS